MVEPSIEFPDDFDAYREEEPAHEPVSLGHALEKLLRPRDEGDDAQPAPRQQQCGICHKMFMAKAGWFAGRWLHASVCANCADGNKLPPGFMDECKRAPIRQMSCVRCGIRRGIDPVLRNNLWHYELTCAHCGARSVTLYRIARLCAGCNEEFNVNENRPERYCSKCKVSGIQPYAKRK